MSKEIELNGNKLILRKGVWSNEDMAMAASLWIDYDEAQNAFVIDLTRTFKKAVVAFLRQVFPAFMKQRIYKEDRHSLQNDLTLAYRELQKSFEVTACERVPYWASLFTHQKEAVFLMHRRQINFLAFEMRTGKTISAATLSKVTGCKRTVIICYTVGKFNYLKDLTQERWNKNGVAFDPFEFTILDSAKRKNLYAFNEKYVVINYEAIGKYYKYLLSNGLRETDHIIIDECQRVKSTTSATHRLVARLVADLPNARITFMTGTPIMNRVDDLFAYFKIAGHPLGASRAEFDRSFLIRTGTRGKVTGAQNIERLQAMMSNFMLRKRLDECVDVPKKAHIKLYHPMGEWRDKYMEAIEKLLENKGNFNDSNYQSVNNLLAQAKVPAAIEHIKMLVEQGQKVCLFTSFSTPLDMICKELDIAGINWVRVDGKVLDAERKIELADRFNNDPDCMVFLGNTRSCGHTISLAAANFMIILNQSLQAGDLVQVLFRDLLLTKTKPTTVYHLICTGEEGEKTIDEIILDLNISKYEDANAVIDDGEKEVGVETAREKLHRAVMEQYGKVTM